MWEAKAILSKTAALDRDKAAEIMHDRFYNERCLCIPIQVFFYDDGTQNKEYVTLAEEIEDEQYSSPLKPCTAVMDEGITTPAQTRCLLEMIPPTSLNPLSALTHS